MKLERKLVYAWRGCYKIKHPGEGGNAMTTAAAAGVEVLYLHGNGAGEETDIQVGITE